MTLELEDCVRHHIGQFACAALLLLLGSSAIAQAQTADDPLFQRAVGVQYALIGIINENDGTSKFGFDVNYLTKSLTQPKTPLGLRASGIGEFGWHRFDGGGSLTLIQGGVQLTSDRFRNDRMALTGRIMGGIGHFPEGTDFNFILMPGLEFFLPGKPYRARVEAGQVWDVFDGGKQAHWRYGFGIVLPLK